jgi:hypothetical protein
MKLTLSWDETEGYSRLKTFADTRQLICRLYVSRPADVMSTDAPTMSQQMEKATWIIFHTQERKYICILFA